jgi:hypothetical protein
MVQGLEGKSYQDSVSKNKVGKMVHTCNPSYSGSRVRIVVQVQWGKS